MDVLEELRRQLTMLEARVASYERLHMEELSELKSMLQDLKMRYVALQSQLANEATLQLDSNSEPAPSP